MPSFTGEDIINGGLERLKKTTLVTGAIVDADPYTKDLLLTCNSVLADDLYTKYPNLDGLNDIAQLTILASTVKYDLSDTAADLEPQRIKKQEVFLSDGTEIENTTREDYYKNIGVAYTGTKKYWYIENDFVTVDDVTSRKSYFVTVPQFTVGSIVYIPYSKAFTTKLTPDNVANILDLPYEYLGYLCDAFAARQSLKDRSVLHEVYQDKANKSIAKVIRNESFNTTPRRLGIESSLKGFMRTGFNKKNTR